MSRGFLVGAVCILSVTGLVGCSEEQPTKPCDQSLMSYLDGTLQAVADCVNSDTVLLIQDASPRVGEEPSLDGNELLRARWRVVNACSDSEELSTATVVEVAVIPTSYAITDADFADAVVCEW